MPNSVTSNQQQLRENGWRHWATARLEVAEYLNADVIAAVTCIEGAVASWLVQAGPARFAEGVARGKGALERAIAQAENAVRRINAGCPIDRDWSPQMFRALDLSDPN